ncbi:MAG TPA: type I-MYXAN CRISPR-associated protein Cmx8 [Gemmataceae bacterium]|nr:type I-MYXAN CRISPR-associated protein Cmx8 [Gemmataceae bacterium]
MSKVKKNDPAKQVESVTIRYDLFDLPTAQHKAGLAGLVLQIRHMQEPNRRVNPHAIPEIVEITPTSATIRFTEESIQGLLDDLYDSCMERVQVKNKWKDAETVEPPREIEETDPATGKIKKATLFVYEVLQPRGSFLRQHLPDKMDRTKDWHKLWRDMLWNIPRGRPTTRIPFQQRHEGRPCREGADAWKELLAVQRARQENGFCTKEVASSLWLGAQAFNAEGVPFRGRAEQNLLLHFWPLTVLIFVPQRIDNDGKSEFAGYTLAIPEVSHLENFCNDYVDLLHNLSTEIRGYRPTEAIIDLPDQAALEFMSNLTRIAAHRVRKKTIHDCVSSVEYVNLVKIGNNIKFTASGRVAPRSSLLDSYLAIAGGQKQPTPYRNPLFRAALLLALLRGRSDRRWYEFMGPLLIERPWSFFVHAEDSPWLQRAFAADAAHKFASEWERYEKERKDNMPLNEQQRDGATLTTPELPLLVHRLVREYVQRRAEDKSGHKWEDFKDKKKTDESGRTRIDIPEGYSKAKEKIASSVFLEMRSRREQDFVEHFTATFCSIKQYLPEREYEVVAEALLKNPDDVKTLTLLALSANS